MSPRKDHYDKHASDKNRTEHEEVHLSSSQLSNLPTIQKQHLTSESSSTVSPKVCTAAQSAFELLKAHRHSDFHEPLFQPQPPLPVPVNTTIAPSSAVAATSPALAAATSRASLTPNKRVCFQSSPLSASGGSDEEAVPGDPETLKKRPVSPPPSPHSPASGHLKKKSKDLHNVRTFDHHSFAPATGVTTTVRGSRRIQQTTLESRSSSQEHHRYDLDLVCTASTSATSALRPRGSAAVAVPRSGTNISTDRSGSIAATASRDEEKSSSVLVRYLVKKPIAVARALTNEVWETFSPQSQ